MSRAVLGLTDKPGVGSRPPVAHAHGTCVPLCDACETRLRVRAALAAPHRCRKCHGPVSDHEAIRSGLLGPMDARCLAETLHAIRRAA